MSANLCKLMQIYTNECTKYAQMNLNYGAKMFAN